MQSSGHDLWSSSDESVPRKPQSEQVQSPDAPPSIPSSNANQDSAESAHHVLFDSSGSESDSSSHHSLRIDINRCDEDMLANKASLGSAEDWRLKYINERMHRKQLQREVKKLQRLLLTTCHTSAHADSITSETSGSIGVVSGASAQKTHWAALAAEENQRKQRLRAFRSSGARQQRQQQHQTNSTAAAINSAEMLPVHSTVTTAATIDDPTASVKSAAEASTVAAAADAELSAVAAAKAQQRARRAHAMRIRAAGTATEVKRTRILPSKLHAVSTSAAPATAAAVQVTPTAGTAASTGTGGRTVDSGDCWCWDSEDDSATLEESRNSTLAKSQKETIEMPQQQATTQQKVELKPTESAAKCANDSNDRAVVEQRLDSRLRQWARGKSIVQLLNSLPEANILPAEAFQNSQLPMQEPTHATIRRNYLRIVKHCHPDKIASLPHDSERFLELQKLFTILCEAYEALRCQELAESEVAAV